MKCNQPLPRSELVSPYQFPTMITITHTHTHTCVCVYIKFITIKKENLDFWSMKISVIYPLLAHFLMNIFREGTAHIYIYIYIYIIAAEQNIDILGHSYYHSELELKYPDTGNEWTYVSAYAWKKSVNTVIGGVGMFLSPLPLKSVNSIERIQPKMMCGTFNTNPLHNYSLLLQFL